MSRPSSLGRIAVVPARGGSKRVPRKNVRPFLGVPLLRRTLDLLHGAELFDRVVVSTDDPEIADLARSAGAEVPFLRPAELADDHTPTVPVIAHAIDALGERHAAYCCVYPASVLVEPQDLRGAFQLLTGGIDYVVTATTFDAPILRALRRHDDGSCEMLWPEHAQTRSQDLEEVVHDAGQFYWGTAAAWLEQRPLFTRSSRLYPLPRWRVQDIDTEEDWQRAESLARALGVAAPA